MKSKCLGLLAALALVNPGCGGGGGEAPAVDAGADAGKAGSDAGPDRAPLAGADGGDADAGAESGTGPGADSAGEAGPEVARAPGMVSGTIVNDSAEDFPWPEGIRFEVRIDGIDTAKAPAVWRNDQFEFTLPEIPAGPHVLRLGEADADGNPTLDLYQAASRVVSIDVAPATTTTATIHLRWHWEPHKVDAAGAIRSCDGITQMTFFGPDEGMLVFNEPSGDAGFADAHAAVMLTKDGGATWSVSSKQMVPGPHQASSGNWFGSVPLLLTPDGQAVLSLPSDGPLVRSADRRATWQAVGFEPPIWGTRGITWGGLARSGSLIYLGAHTGGVQGSNDRDSLSRSSDGGLTWQVIRDRCDRNESDAACATPNQPALPLGFAGLDIGCGAPGHCVVIGSRAVLHTSDDFVTQDSFSVLPPGFGCGYAIDAARVYWVTPSTAWVVAPATGCGVPAPMRRISTDGGKSFGDWQPSPVSPGGDLVFANAETGFNLEARQVRITNDGGTTWRSTGPAPSGRGALAGLRLSVVDASHAWVSSTATGGCGQQTYSWVARWRP